MNKKFILFSLIIVIIGLGIFIFVENNKANIGDSYVYVTDDYIGSWYFDKDSIGKRTDLIDNIEVIDVWMTRIVDKAENAIGSDVLLWHIDPLKMRYRVSDSLAYDEENKLLDA